MRPTIAQVSALSSTFDNDVREFSAAGWKSLEIWLTKLETHLAAHSLQEVRTELDRLELAAPVASLQGGLFAERSDSRAEAWALLERRLQICRDLQVETLVVAGDIPTTFQVNDLEGLRLGLQKLARKGADFNVRIAWEFQATSGFGNNLQSAVALVDDCRHPFLGLCLDVFHWATGPSKLADLGLLSSGNLFHVQVCDLAGVPRELARDSHRILPGDGELPLTTILERLRQIGYQGCVSLEVFNPILWQVRPRQLGEVGWSALERLLAPPQE